jgi:nicotinamidase-related amidase
VTLAANAALIVVDVQQAFDDPVWGERNNPQAEANIARLLEHWRDSSRPIFHIQHENEAPGGMFHPDGPGHTAKAQAQPIGSEPVIGKTVNSAFIGTDLEQRLRDQSIDELVIVGITTDHCVSTTARMAGNLDFTTWVVSDATATFERTGPDGQHYSAALMHDAALASIHDEFAEVLTTDAVLALA